MQTDQHLITTPGPLLNEDGTLREAGYATSLILDYNRQNCGKSAFWIKEWDYYLITDGAKGVALTVADNGYMGMLSASLLNFDAPTPNEQTTSVITAFPMGKFKLPPSSKSGVTRFQNKRCSFVFEAVPIVGTGRANRILRCTMQNFKDGKPFTCEFSLTGEGEDSMVIATPYAEDKKAFYYNQKIVGMRAEGFCEFDGERHEFSPAQATGLLDWGRGIWTHNNTWYWGSAAGTVNGHRFGFNIGYGFGDTSAASENMLFYDGKAHKIDRVTFNIPPKDAALPPGKGHLGDHFEYTAPWTFTSSDGRFTMAFVPVIDRAACLDFKLICSDQHQVFGRFTGTAILDDGTEIHLKDFFGFAEHVHNKW